MISRFYGSSFKFDVMNDEDNSGTSLLKNHLEEILSSFLDEKLLVDVLIAQNDSKRKSMWEIREAAAEITVSETCSYNGCFSTT